MEVRLGASLSIAGGRLHSRLEARPRAKLPIRREWSRRNAIIRHDSRERNEMHSANTHKNRRHRRARTHRPNTMRKSKADEKLRVSQREWGWRMRVLMASAPRAPT